MCKSQLLQLSNSNCEEQIKNRQTLGYNEVKTICMKVSLIH